MLKRGFQFAPGYRLQEFLGRGQFGQVWRASAPGGAATAVKFIDLSDGQGQKEYDAVRRVKQIRHANLMPITAIWLLDAQGRVIEEAPDEALETIDLSVPEAPGQSAVYPHDVEPSWLVVAMLLGGKSLQDRLRECVDKGLPGIPPKELIAYMDEAAKGLDFLNKPQHDLGEGPIAIQHCDVKPANIVLIGTSAVVCDFGLARILSRNQVTATSPSGTPAYMAPEAISGKPARTSDQYSLAVTYYHLRTGSLPVNDGSVWEVLDAHRRGKLNLGSVSQAEQLVLRKATDLNWENRFESNVDFVDSLREALRAEGENRPSFAPLASQTAQVSEGPTARIAGDPTATTDALTNDTNPNEALAATAPSLAADHSTQQSPLIAATTTVAEQAVSGGQAAATPEITESADRSLRNRIKQNPKTATGIAAALLALCGLLIIFAGGDQAIVPEPPPIPPTPKPAEELLAEAIALVDSDFDTAKQLYQQAIEQQPRLSPEATRLSDQDSGPVMQMRVTPDGRWLVSMADGPVLSLRDLFDLQAPTILLQGHEQLLNDFAVDASGRLLLSGGFDSTPRVWDLQSSSPADSAWLLPGLEGSIEAVAWSPRHPLALAASDAMQLGVWELDFNESPGVAEPIRRQRQLDVGTLITQLRCDPTETWIAALSTGMDLLAPEPDVLIYRCEELWDVEGSPPPAALNAKRAKQLVFLGGQQNPTLAIGEVGGSVALYSIGDDNSLLQRLEPDAFNAADHIEAMTAVTLPTGDAILAGSSEGSLLWWKYGEANEHQRQQFDGVAISCVDLSADGRWAAAGSDDGSLWLWDTNAGDGKGAIQVVAHSGEIDAIQMSPDQHWVMAGCDDGAIRKWDLRHLKLMTSVARTLELKIEPEDSKPESLESPQVARKRDAIGVGAWSDLAVGQWGSRQ